MGILLLSTLLAERLRGFHELIDFSVSVRKVILYDLCWFTELAKTLTTVKLYSEIYLQIIP